MEKENFLIENEFGDTYHDLNAETKYFNERIKIINNYTSSYKTRALNDLRTRYIKKIIELEDLFNKIENADNSVKYLYDMYMDFLAQLGIDSYCLEHEIADFKKRQALDGTTTLNSGAKKL